MRKSLIYLAVFSLLPSTTFAEAPRTFSELAALVVILLNNATAVLVVAGIVVYFYGVSTNILNFSKEGGEKLRAYFLWGIIVLFVMVSIWGILRLLQETLFGAGDFKSGDNSVKSTDLSEFPIFGK